MVQVLTKPAKSDPVLARLTALHPKRIDLSLGRIERLLDRLGRPDLKLPPALHIAGTNGKGSLAAYLRAMLEAAGYRVHVYTSPHLVRFNERIRLAGRIIGDEPLVAALEEVERGNAGDPITFFEATTAAAFLAFAATPADVLVLETGLGGRLDATNVLARPELTAITPVSLDHQEFLGTRLEQIAAEKAGILKPGVPAVLGPQEAAAAAVIAARAQELSAPLFRHGADWRAEAAPAGAPQRLLWSGEGEKFDLPLPALAGEHQILNAGTAIACIRRLKTFSVPEAAIARGLVTAEWPARLQRLRQGPLVKLIPPGAELWLDGGHNPSAGRALAATAAAWAKADRDREGQARPLTFIVGMKENKDLSGFLEPLASLAPGQALQAVAIPDDPHCHAPESIAATARSLGFAAEATQGVGPALKALGKRAAAPPPRILICGSLYLAGAVLAENGTADLV